MRGPVATTSSYKVTKHALNGCLGSVADRQIPLEGSPSGRRSIFGPGPPPSCGPMITVNFQPPLTRQCDSSDLRTVTYGPTAPSPREGRTHGGRRTMTSHWPGDVVMRAPRSPTDRSGLVWARVWQSNCPPSLTRPSSRFDPRIRYRRLPRHSYLSTSFTIVCG